MNKIATFAAGCFWSVENKFMNTKGVASTRVGYIGGETDNPTYDEVCAGRTGHHEAVEVTYNPEEISYSELLKVFWNLHDPTTRNRQGLDTGEQYHSVIFYHDDEQKEDAEKSKEELKESGIYKNAIVTDIEKASTFHEAEDYHQRYIQKRGGGVCGA